MKKYIEAGQAQDIWWNVTDLGYLTYHVAQLIAQCKITGKEGETFTAGRLGDYTVGAERRDRPRPGQDRDPGEPVGIQVLTVRAPGWRLPGAGAAVASGHA